MALSVSCTCCALVSTSAGCWGYLCYPSAIMRLWPLVIKPCALIPDSVHTCCTLVPEMLCHPSHVLIAQWGKVLQLPLRSYCLSHWISQFWFDKLKEEIYMEQPEGFVVKGQEKKVCKLVKSIYGLKQAGRVWYELMADTLRRKLGFERIHSDAGVYILR